MPLFSPTNPFDGDVERATSESNSTEDWSLITDICSQVEASPNGSKDCLMAIMKRVQHKVPLVAMHSLTLLEACVSSCGKPFQVQICSKEFSDEVTKVLEKAHPKVCDRLKAMLVEWWEKFKNDSQMCLLFFIIKNLKDKEIEFPALGSKEMEAAKAGFGSPAKEPSKGVVRSKEEDDLAKAIELSIKEQKQYPSLSGVGGSSSSTTSSVGPSLASPPSLYPQAVMTSIPLGAPSGVVRKVRALYDFEAAEDNELTFRAGEILTVLDDSDANWWKGETESGLGLFPSNFVTADLTAEPESVRRYEIREEPEEVPTAEPDPEPLSINEERMDHVLHMLQSLDPKDDRPESAELLRLEESCHQMGPLIDQKLEEIDRKHSELSEMNANLGDAISLYNRLMKETHYYCPYSKVHTEHQYYPGQQSASGSQGYAGPSGPHYAPPQGYVPPNEQPAPLNSLPQFPTAPHHVQPPPQHTTNPSIGVGSMPPAMQYASLPAMAGQAASYAPSHPYGTPPMPPAFASQQQPSGYPPQQQQQQYPGYQVHNQVSVNPGYVSAQPLIHAQAQHMHQPLL
ncbi:signal transducing adapter molecule 1-like [Lethenteron reissneri]|uniref:signal transducing adapter molecule 1-like n=1 Tax=Lethenteron reissneri TaxID=7753 RepID=UPI002AB7096A|nr:signal transducing adapter molecule 1-like [Lethenteron reissneri]